MMLMGDELARAQHGNNNTYCHDDETNWMNWALAETNADLVRFVSRLTEFRAAHPALRRREFLTGCDVVGSGRPDISWHGPHAWHPDWSSDSRTLAFLLCGRHAKDDDIYVAFNMHWDSHIFELPPLPEGKRWHVFANTGCAAPDDVYDVGAEPALPDQGHIFMGPRSALILIGK
jgi:glycogen operon protein